MINILQREHPHTVVVVLPPTNDQFPAKYPSEITHSDPFDTPEGKEVQCKYKSTGTVFTISLDGLNDAKAKAKQAGYSIFVETAEETPTT